ncbi:hypothetical protein SteCoe_16460 [Stentor coeruleus]|uniref:Uncharacterized protein n=1 Tax=Stentor coeruleus TaxID=5963 RepID=A0A1R2C1D7_9CILI|nr:hypothetical protein SteCoe_16460 [Stentor coeruleus]
MKDTLSLFYISLQALILRHILAEELYVDVLNRSNPLTRKRPKKKIIRLFSEEKLEKNLACSEQSDKSTIETLSINEEIPKKRKSENKPQGKVKKFKNDMENSISEELDISDIMSIDKNKHEHIKPIFSKKETMPQIYNKISSVKESKINAEDNIKINKIPNVMAYIVI